MAKKNATPTGLPASDCGNPEPVGNWDNEPTFLEGRAARKGGKAKTECPYDDTLGMRYLWECGWEVEKDSEGSRYWCDKCRKPLYDATSCGNCGSYGTT